MFTTDMIGPIIFYVIGAAGITWGVVAVIQAYLRDPADPHWRASHFGPHPRA
jgi:uncharacterized membrane protein